MTLIMIPTNYIILPIWGIPKEVVQDLFLRSPPVQSDQEHLVLFLHIYCTNE